MRCIKDIIRGLREDRDFKQKDIAKVLGINQQYYSKYETGEYEIPCRHIITLCKFYNVTADYILGLTDYELPIGNGFIKNENLDNVEKIVNNFKKLDDKEKLIVFELINLICNKKCKK